MCWRWRGTRGVRAGGGGGRTPCGGGDVDDMGRVLEVSEGLEHLLLVAEMMLCMLEAEEEIIRDVSYGRWGFCPIVADNHPSASGSTHVCETPKKK